MTEKSSPRDSILPPAFRVVWPGHTRLLLNSFEYFVGRPLIVRSGADIEDAERLYAAPFAVLSHGTEADPILNYANAVALRLWEATPEFLVTMPSRATAEPMLHQAREKLLDETRSKGHVTGYSGWRISCSGRRFKIENVTIWNVIDADGAPRGQAATFDRWS